MIGGMRMASKRHAIVDKTICAACGACETACPLGAIKVFKGCFAKVAEDKCIGCGKCVKVCPANSIKTENRGSI
jgi:NAD-dependent dihydropyrimidine dehydrogenase PreA subunit